MKKNIICSLLIFLLAIGIYPCRVSADAESTEKSQASVTSLSDGYKAYLEQYSEFPDAAENVVADLKGAIASDEASITFQSEYNGKENVLFWENGRGKIDFSVTVPANGKYTIAICYYVPGDNDGNINFSLNVDDCSPFKECERFSLPQIWTDSGDIRKDGLGNEFAPKQQQLHAWQTVELSDSSGLYNDNFEFGFKAGIHKISLTADTMGFAIAEIMLQAPETINAYSKALEDNGFNQSMLYEGKQICVEGESVFCKSANYLVPQSDRTSCTVYPNNAVHAKINYIGGNNWSSAGDKITWKISIPESGYYKLGYRYQQSYVMNGKSYRKLKIDGKVPFEEAKALSFDYSYNWTSGTFSNDSDQPYLLYLEKGEHFLSLEVTLGEMSELAISLQELISKIGVMYREITMITGTSPDSNRDYNLFGQIPDFENRLIYCRDELKHLAVQSEKLSEEKGGSNASIIRNMANVMDMMLKYKYQAHNYQSAFYDNFSSISAWLYDISNMPLDIDCLFLTADCADYYFESPGFIKKINFSLKRLAVSFSQEYNSMSDTSGYDDGITLWVNWGRDQVQILNHLVQSDFSPEHGIGVNIKMTNASLVQAILSGNGPDCYLHLSRTQPINLAMRNALVDLTKFNDFTEVMKSFMPSAAVPYTYHDGVYALPDTQTYYMLFYREDILKQYGLSVPETWDQFVNTASVLMRNNLQIGLPYTQITNMSQVDLGTGALNLFPTFVAQQGKTIYSDDLKSAQLLSKESINAFTKLTDFYTEYSFPKSYDFYNRFRSGLMPMGIQNYTMYSTLKSAASEINGLWKMAQIPGTIQADGSVNNSQVAGGTGAVIFKKSQNKDVAWQFLKWWVSSDVQYTYSREVESVLGIVARNASANVDAVSRLNWDSGVFSVLKGQWAEVEEWPEIPGGYYIPRAVDQVFWNVLNSGKSVKQMLLKWNSVVNLEIEEKISQYED